jgi:hypothetical protein
VAFDGQTYVLSGEATFLEWVSIPGKESWQETGVPAIWYSQDLGEWRRATVPSGPSIEAVVATNSGFVAFGPDFSGPGTKTQVLASVAGDEWTTAGSLSGYVDHAAAIGDLIVAFGSIDDLTSAWTSADAGQTWQQPSTESAADVADGLLTLYASDGFVWAIRSDDPIDDPSIVTPVELWRTEDGLEWELITKLPDSISVNDAVMTSGLHGLVISARRITFRNGVQATEWFAWHSADGISWQAARTPPQYVDQIIGDVAGFIAIGGALDCCAVEESDVLQNTWVSADGATWIQMPDEGWRGREIDFLVSDGVSVVGPGIDWRLVEGDTGFPGGWGVVWSVDRDQLTG